MILTRILLISHVYSNFLFYLISVILTRFSEDTCIQRGLFLLRKQDSLFGTCIFKLSFLLNICILTRFSNVWYMYQNIWVIRESLITPLVHVSSKFLFYLISVLLTRISDYPFGTCIFKLSFFT